MAELIKVNAPVRKPLFEGVQGENEARSIQFDITPWVEELGDGVVTATAKRSQDSQPYPVTVTKDGTTVTWKPTSTDTAFAGVGSFQLEYTVDSVLAKTCIWSTMVAPSLDPAGDPPDPYDNWLAEMREIAADALQDAQNADASAQDAEAWAKGTKNGTPVPSTADQYENNAKYYSEESYKNAEAWAVGQRGGVDVPSTDPTYENNAKYWAEQSLANQYSAFIVKSASGEIASFSDGADDVPMKSLNVTITPKQSGSGDPSPSNVRPISGTSTAEVYVRGVNLWDEVWELGKLDLSTGANSNSSTNMRSKNYIPIPEGQNFYNLDPTGNADIRFCYYDINKNFLGAGGWSTAGVRVPITGTRYVRFFCGSAAGTTYQNNISINIPTTDHEYHPYVGHTTPVPLGQTVYGGTVNPISGELVIDKAGVDLGTLTWTLDASYSRFYTTSIASLIKAPANNWTPITGAICSNYSVTDNNSTAQASHNNQFGVAANGRLDIRDEAYTTAADFKTAMNGVMFVYPLKNPTTVQLTPTQVATLLGTNNVWADCGSVEVEYRADPTLAYAELQALILENL